jgi:uncharacterized protein YdhG (YjbR/CyaY superfamily)
VDAYIGAFPDEVRAVLEAIRAMIREAEPEAEETISYRIPTFTLEGRYLLYFAAFERHVSVYPRPRGDAALDEAMAPYASGKGTLKFPLGKPVPLDLIRRVVEARSRENRERASAKRKR